MHQKTLKTAVLAAYLTSSLCASSVLAQDRFPAVPVGKATSTQSKLPSVMDVALSSDGVLKGQVLSSQGKAIDGARVIISQQQTKVVETVTTQSGLFAVSGLKSGLYQIDSPGKSQIIRVWAHQVAPETSKDVAILVQGDPTVRGQFGYIDPVSATSIALGITAVTLSAITLKKVDDLRHSP